MSKIVVYAAGAMLDDFLNKNPEFLNKIDYIVDSDLKKVGTVCWGHKVYAKEFLYDLKGEIIVYISSLPYFEEIKKIIYGINPTIEVRKLWEESISSRGNAFYKSYEDQIKLLRENIDVVPRDIDVVIGIPRSGMVAASYIALLLNKNLTDIVTFVKNNGIVDDMPCTKRKDDKKDDVIKKVLVVDDSCSSGARIQQSKEMLKGFKNIEAIFLSLYVTGAAKEYVDIYLEVCEFPRYFEWNIMHRKDSKHYCMDIDGVLCKDPTVEENDDAIQYEHFLRNAKPLYIPTYKVGTLITCRLEKYRAITENWLKNNGVQYDELIMLNMENGEERKQWGKYAEFKAREYALRSDATLFIESNLEQAIKIYNITNKNVLCIENNQMFVRDDSLDNYFYKYYSMKHDCSINELWEDARRVTDRAWKAEEFLVKERIKSDIWDKEHNWENYEKEINYLKEKGELCLYPYPFVEEYDEKRIEVYFDEIKKQKYVYHNGKKLFFPNREDESIIKEYRRLCIEQDMRCPHSYSKEGHEIDSDSILLDIGGAEGIFALDNVSKAKEIYIFETSEEWIEALKCTFSEYENVHIIQALVGDVSSDRVISLDDFFKNNMSTKYFLKIDVEGMEKEVLIGARNLMQEAECLVSCASYHTQSQADELKRYLGNQNYQWIESDGYMLFYYGYQTMLNGKYRRQKYPYFRKAIIYAQKNFSTKDKI